MTPRSSSLTSWTYSLGVACRPNMTVMLVILWVFALLRCALGWWWWHDVHKLIFVRQASCCSMYGGWVGYGLGWVGSMKIDPRTTLWHAHCVGFLAQAELTVQWVIRRRIDPVVYYELRWLSTVVRYVRIGSALSHDAVELGGRLRRSSPAFICLIQNFNIALL